MLEPGAEDSQLEDDLEDDWQKLSSLRSNAKNERHEREKLHILE